MYIGEYTHSIDNKGRVIVPAKYREQLGDSFYISPGFDPYCLYVHSRREWEEFYTKLQELPLLDREARKLIRYFSTGLVECEVDKQGRVSIPSKLRAIAEIKKDVVFAGVGSKVEIWSAEHYEEVDNYQSEDIEAMTKHMMALGLSF